MPGKRKTGYWTTGLACLCMVSCIMCIMLCGLLAGCGEETGGAETQEPVSRDFFAMDTYMTVTAYGEQAEQATEAAEEEVYRLDAMLSAGSADSEIGRLNADGSGTLSEETAGLVKRGLEAEDVAAITSGAYERNFTKGGRFYHHIIDPATGEPADSGLQSVTIVSNDGTLADALSTSLFIMGKEQAIQYWRAHSDEFGCILLDEDNELFVSENIADSFHSDNYPVTVFE